MTQVAFGIQDFESAHAEYPFVLGGESLQSNWRVKILPHLLNKRDGQKNNELQKALKKGLLELKGEKEEAFDTFSKKMPREFGTNNAGVPPISGPVL